MKLIVSILFLLSFCNFGFSEVIEFNSFSTSTVESISRGNDLNINFNIANLFIDDFSVQKDGFSLKKIKIDGLRLTSYKNKASLPFYSVLVKASPESLSISYEEGRNISFKNILPLNSSEQNCRCREQVRSLFDSKVYLNSDLGKYSIHYLGDFRGTPISRIMFFPVEFNGRGIKVSPNIKFKVSIKNNEKVEVVGEGFDKLAKFETNNKYLIVAPDKYANALSEFIRWKESAGFEVTLHTLEEAGNSFEEIKSFISSKYNNNADKFTYALLVGNEKEFPTDYVETKFDRQTPSDLGYFTMGGNGDYIPDVFYGRMTVRTTVDIINQTKKIIAYETSDYTDSAGIKNYIGIASDEGSNPSDVEYIKMMALPLFETFNTDISYFFQENSDSNAENINTVLNQGVSWLNYIGHGSGSSWPSLSSGNYSIDDIKSLSPDIVKPVIIDVACQNGRFSNEGRLGERFMNETNVGLPIGAVAYYGGSVDISWDPPAIMAVGISELLSEQTYDRLGDLLLAGQLYLANNHSAEDEVIENFKWYHLQGDPTLKLNKFE
jgi:hypothetical protein